MMYLIMAWSMLGLIGGVWLWKSLPLHRPDPNHLTTYGDVAGNIAFILLSILFGLFTLFIAISCQPFWKKPIPTSKNMIRRLRSE